LSAHYGDLILASCSILMKILMLFSYFTDGFAYAGEALVGRFIGARDAFRMRKSVVWTFVWSMGLAAVFILVYAFGGRLLVEIMTSDEAVIEMVMRYIPWLLAMPLIGCAAFTWDGIFIGATATKDLRNSLVWATVAFFAAFFVGLWILQAFTLSSETFGIVIVHILMAAYFAHLIVRTVYMSARYKSSVLSQLPE
ncbi:MAG: MATE family efflux transporter, partial [Candidatus Cryptobacteroides sp.]